MSSDHSQILSVLSRLREKYEKEGYLFLVSPSAEVLPSFLGSHQPDAIALKDTGGVIIEVKSKNIRPTDNKISRLHDTISRYPEWSIQVYYIGSPGTLDDTSEIKDIQFAKSMISEVKWLSDNGKFIPALMLGWSIMEALFSKLNAKEKFSHTQSIRSLQAVEFLESNGILSFEEAKFIRDLSRKRNRLSHGDFEQSVYPNEIEKLLGIVNVISTYLERGPHAEW